VPNNKLEKSPDKFIVEPIGFIKTPYIDKYQAPRQPGAGNEKIEGIITLVPHKNYEQALGDLNGFEKIWIISWFDRNTEWKPKVLPPRSGRTKRGLFATRSPHRPNPIGISVCTLLEVNGLTIRVENPDLLDGTPILDIKPYIPYADSFPAVRAGWIDTLNGSSQKYSVIIASPAQEQCAWLEKKWNIIFIQHIKNIIALDPFPHPFRRIKKISDNDFVIRYKSWRILYKIVDSIIVIHAIQSGYTLDALHQLSQQKAERDNKHAHLQFLETWK